MFFVFGKPYKESKMLSEIANPVKFKRGDQAVFIKEGLALKNDKIVTIVKGNYRKAGNTLVDIRFNDGSKSVNSMYVAQLVKATDAEVSMGKRL